MPRTREISGVRVDGGTWTVGLKRGLADDDESDDYYIVHRHAVAPDRGYATDATADLAWSVVPCRGPYVS